ncbi:hypothetical protein [Agreia sp. COWG]|uniref:hypothetical protein n=1 Tax=Agreia sp. COWG TaxID=2773266 RepID=UPI0019256D58|nr:hypothetical protein [Agreia sp. COWG]CAD6004877.1 conserved protein of unknown function [Agreia sp. COWG]
MRVLLKFVLDTDPDAAWRAIRSPAVFQEVSSPFLKVRSLEADGFPTMWTPGEHPVEISGGGLVPLGKQVIDLRFIERPDGVRIVRDSGRGLTGAVSVPTEWDHQMAIAPDPAGTGKTLYRDRLIIGAGLLTPAAWYGMWAFWQWRGARIRQLAKGWAFDPEIDNLGPAA